MAKRSSNQQIATEVLLVASGNQAVATATSLTGTGNSLNIASGQLGVNSKDTHGTRLPGTLITAGDTSTNVTKVELVQGTPNSTNLSAVSAMGNGHKAVVRSPYLDAKTIQSVSTTKFAPATNGAVLLEGIGTPVVSTTYNFFMDMESVRADFVQGDNFDTKAYSITTPATLPVDSDDFILQNLGIKSLADSVVGRGVSPFVMFGIKLAGGSGTAMSAIQAGTSVNVALVNSVQYSYVFDTEAIATLQRALADTNIVAASTIENLNSVVPGSAATVDALLIMTLPQALTEASDYVVERRVALKNLGFNNSLVFTATPACPAFEGFGYGRQVKLMFEKRARQMQFGYQNEYVNGMPFVQAPSYVDETLNYAITVISAEDITESLNSDTKHARKVVIALPCAISNPTAVVSAAGGYTVATTASTTVTGLNNILGAWMKSADDVFGNIEYLGAATAAAPFA